MEKQKTGIKFKKCNVSSAEVHNARNTAYLAAVAKSPKKYYDIFSDKTQNNLSWRNPVYSDQTLPDILKELRVLVKEKTGRTMQEADRIKKYKDPKTNEVREKVIAGSSPIREGCAPILPTTKIEDFKPVVDWLEQRGVHTIAIYLHFDEGHIDAVTKERRYNNHAHVIVDWMDHATGKSIKLNERDMSEVQTVLSEALGMERGDLKENTGKEGLSAKEYREHKAGEAVARLEQQKNELESECASLQEENRQILIEACHSLQTAAKNNVVQFDRLVKEANGAVVPTAQEKDNRDQLAKEVVRDIKSLTAQELQKENVMLHKLIDATFKDINKIGEKLREIAANVPKFTLLPGRKGKMLAHEAELQAKVSNAQADAQNAVREAENAKEKANRMLSQAAQREKAANEREKAARVQLDNMQTKLTAAKEEGRKAGYADGYSDGKASENAKTIAKLEEIEALRTSHADEIEKLKKSAILERSWKELFRKTNPYLANAEQNWKELTELKEWPLTNEEIVSILAGEVVKKTYSETRNFKQIQLPVRIEVAASDQGNMRVWYNDTTKDKCLQKLRDEVVKRSKGDGMSVNR